MEVNRYCVELNFPFDPNVESALYAEGVLVSFGELGKSYIYIETELNEDELLSRCKVDIAAIILEM
jgi:hypothetical protein